ncbi:polysaccharide deacetylase family protein [Marinirhabdus gelatinilytica]|uniref:Peptidoglycan/xylan/chitin deacetylase (PgdA/CDA1 family) n=1 Tax=Marinirhabdus gelatinilytica TaxID=1703343 RepID=A0A370QKZ6_9FLAO|nr:polysaccharide deacetylase family protein [Marinirhabdus gelatinilytica]RDK88720.1 peptidoglycan/xylan/chitin deacetylase (PgdA/CDA1 family) [Marinirhabdus gelatinilytica]
MNYLVKTPKLVQWLFPQRVWAFTPKEPNVYLTFDDGPIPEVTPWALELLKKHNAKATFFCIGDNVRKHPKIFRQLLAEGHAIGNHTQHHLKGSNTTTQKYLEDVALFEASLKNVTNSASSNLFRPPYGKMTSAQAKKLQEKGYKIIMWDVLSADFDASISEEKCLNNVLRHIQTGSIVVFHDSLKAEGKLRYVLPKVLAFIDKKGWNCASIQFP